MDNTKNIPGQQGFDEKKPQQDPQKKDIPVEQLPKKDMPGQQGGKGQPFKQGGGKYGTEDDQSVRRNVPNVEKSDKDIDRGYQAGERNTDFPKKEG